MRKYQVDIDIMEDHGVFNVFSLFSFFSKSIAHSNCHFRNLRYRRQPSVPLPAFGRPNLVRELCGSHESILKQVDTLVIQYIYIIYI